MNFTGWMLIRYIDQLSLNLFYFFNLDDWLFGIMEGSYKVTIIIGSYYSSLCNRNTFLALLHIQSLSYFCAELRIMTLLVSHPGTQCLHKLSVPENTCSQGWRNCLRGRDQHPALSAYSGGLCKCSPPLWLQRLVFLGEDMQNLPTTNIFVV